GGDGEAAVSGSVFKIERDPEGHRIAFTRLFTGGVTVRDRFDAGKVTAIRVFADGDAVQRDTVQAGEIAKLWGLGEIQIGDWLGKPPRGVGDHLAPPTFEAGGAHGEHPGGPPRPPGPARLAARDPVRRLSQG